MAEQVSDLSETEVIKNLIKRIEALEGKQLQGKNPMGDVQLETSRSRKMQREIYPNNYGKGLAVMLVNYFDRKDMEEMKRKGAGETDTSKMEKLWKTTLKCDFEVHEDKTATEMKEILEAAANAKNEAYDYIVIMISTHGAMYAESAVKHGEGLMDPKATSKDNKESVCKAQEKAEINGEISAVEVFFGNDYLPVRERDIKKMFYNTSQTSAWHGKPKFFILDYCRGSKKDYGYRMKSGPIMDESNEVEVTSLIPSVSDVVVAYATHPYFIAWKHTEDGSWLISTIADIFKDNYLDIDVITMLTMVNKAMKGKTAKIRTNEKDKDHDVKAMSVFQSSLDKDFFLSAVRPQN